MVHAAQTSILYRSGGETYLRELLIPSALRERLSLFRIQQNFIPALNPSMRAGNITASVSGSRPGITLVYRGLTGSDQEAENCLPASVVTRTPRPDPATSEKNYEPKPLM